MGSIEYMQTESAIHRESDVVTNAHKEIDEAEFEPKTPLNLIWNKR